MCYQFAAFISNLYTKYDIPVSFSPVFLRFKFCRFRKEAFVAKKELFSRLFCSFLVNKRLRILNVVTTHNALYIKRTSVLSLVRNTVDFTSLGTCVNICVRAWTGRRLSFLHANPRDTNFGTTAFIAVGLRGEWMQNARLRLHAIFMRVPSEVKSTVSIIAQRAPCALTTLYRLPNDSMQSMHSYSNRVQNCILFCCLFLIKLYIWTLIL